MPSNSAVCFTVKPIRASVPSPYKQSVERRAIFSDWPDMNDRNENSFETVVRWGRNAFQLSASASSTSCSSFSFWLIVAWIS